MKVQRPSTLGKSRGSRTSDPWDVENTPLTYCIVCGKPALEWHHIIPVRRLRKAVASELVERAIRDVRNQVQVDRPCHDRIESDALRLEPHELHDGFLDFIAEYDVAGLEPRHLSEWAAAA